MCLVFTASKDLDRFQARFRSSPAVERVLWNDDTDVCVGVFAPGLDEPRLIGEVISAARNIAPDDQTTRIRLVLHEGLVSLTDGRFCGPAITDARDLGVHSLRREAAGLRVVLTQRVFDDVSRLAPHVVSPEDFRHDETAPVPAHVSIW